MVGCRTEGFVKSRDELFKMERNFGTLIGACIAEGITDSV